MPSKSKAKGNAWELDVAKHLSTVYSESFTRTLGSGAKIGGSNSYKKSVYGSNQIQAFKGDIFTPSGWDFLNVEAKSYKDFPYHQLFEQEVKILDGWIAQMLEVADSDDLNILFMKFNRKGKWVLCPSTLGFAAYGMYTYKQNWSFCSWDHFWDVKSNVEKFRLYSTNGISATSSE